MKKLLLIVLIAASAALSTQAATKYQINIAGVEVTSDNAGYITGGDITGGYGVYNSSTNTLTLYSIKIERSGQDNYGIHNRECNNLTIVFNGNCEIATSDNALKLERSTTLNAEAGSYTQFYTAARICANLKSYSYYIKGSGTLEFLSRQSGYEAIKGGGTSSTKVYFQGAKVSASSKNRSALDSFAAYFQSGADLTITGNGSYASVNNVSMSFSGREAVLSPYGAYYSNNSIYNSSGSQITSGDIYISDNYVAIINSTNFPDNNFRNYLFGLYTKGYITQTDVNSRTSLDVSGKSISNLTGVGYFSKLTSLYCNKNRLTSLPTLPSTITTLECNSNQLTSLPALPSSLETLDCYENQLTSLPSLPSSLETLRCQENKLTSLPALPSSIRILDASNNEFTSLTITGKTKLKKLYLNNNTNLTSLNCSGNALEDLNVTGCKAMISFNCKNNKLTSLNIYNFYSLRVLDCSGNQISSLDVSSNNNVREIYCNDNKLTSMSLPYPITGMSTNLLQILYCQNNQFSKLESITNLDKCTYLEIFDCSNINLKDLNLPDLIRLKKLYCKYNTTLTEVYLYESYINALEVLDVTGCSALKKLDCEGKKLTNLNISGCNTLEYLYCSENQLTSLPTLPSSLVTLKCNNNQLTSLPTLPSSLEYLAANNNKLTSLPTLPSAITTLHCSNNQLTSLPTLPSSLEGLDVSKNKFTSLTINNILNLTSLDVSDNTLLTNLNARDNALIWVNVTGCSALSYVQLQHNNISKLDLTGCSKLHDLYITRNKIKGDDMTALINSLRSIPESESEGVFGVIAKNSGSPEYNEITTEQVKAARDKRWRAQEIDGNTGRWEDIPVQGSGLRGDVDGNGMVDLDDVNATINLILFYNQYKDKYPGNADLNGDRLIDVDDVKEIINIILEQ